MALVYPDSVISSYENQPLSGNLSKLGYLVFEEDYGKVINTIIAKNLIRPAYFVDDIGDIFLKY